MLSLFLSCDAVKSSLQSFKNNKFQLRKCCSTCLGRRIGQQDWLALCQSCSSGTRRRWKIYCHMTETYDHFVQLDLEIFYQQFFWPALYATPGTPAHMETCFQYKQVNYVSWMTMIHLVVLCLSFLISIYI